MMQSNIAESHFVALKPHNRSNKRLGETKERKKKNKYWSGCSSV